jgi:hypothetical protein
MQGDSTDPRWSFVDCIPFRWLQQLYSQVPRSKIPILKGQTLFVATDSSGMQRGSRYVVLGILIVDADYSRSWHLDRLRIRGETLKDGRRMSYKNLNDGQRRAALVPFLEAADRMRGLCFLMAFDKRLGKVCTSDALYERAKTNGVITGKWKPHAFEEMMRTTQLVSTLMAAVAVKDQNICWISDMDERFETPERRVDTARMISAFTSEYIKHSLGELTMGTTEIDEGDRLEEDLTAIPDLAAGAACDLLNGLHERFGRVPSIPSIAPALKGKAELINTWFFNPDTSLVKLACILKEVPGKGMQVGSFALQE